MKIQRLAPALLLALAGALGAAVQPAPATIQTNDQPIDNVWVIQETTDGVDFYLGDPSKDARNAVPRPTGIASTVQT